MMGASTYEGVYIAAQAIENAGTLDKVMVRNAIASLDMPQVVEPMQGGMITFTEDYREAKFELYMEQLIWDDSAAELRPKIIWPDSLKEEDLILPDWYVPGSE
jgi:branched-chain amino acid transport system substrate-binding protein